jgi:hypothetical protein
MVSYCEPYPRIQCMSHSPQGKTHVVKAVGDELQVPEADGLALGKLDTSQVAVIGDDRGFSK